MKKFKGLINVALSYEKKPAPACDSLNGYVVSKTGEPNNKGKQRMQDSEFSKGWPFSLLVFLLAAIFFSWWLSLPPAPFPDTAPETEFSAARAMKHVEVMARKPHPASSAENDRVCEYIQGQVRALGLEMTLIDDPKHDGGNRVEWRRAVLGRIRGTNPTKAFAMDAHFDSTPYGPGAADDIACIAAMLETARALQQGPPLENDVIFCFADQEEVGGNGARAFTEHPWFEEVGVMLGLEARGVRGPSLMFETSDENGWLIRELKRSGVAARANSVMFSVYDRLPFGSDFGLYKRHVPGYNLAFIDGFGYYHTRLDRPDKVSLASIQHHGDYMLGLARHLGNIPLDNCRSPNATYFNTLGSRLVVYPQTWDKPFTALALLLLFTGVVLGVARGAIRIPQLLAALFLMALALFLAAAAAVPGIVALVYYREASLYQNTLYCVGMALMGAAPLLLIFGLARRRLFGSELLTATLFFWTGMLYPLHKYLSGGAHIVIWPMMFGSAALIALTLTHSRNGEQSPRLLMAAAVWMLPVIAFLTPLLIMVAYTLTPLGAFLINPLLALALGLLAPQIVLITRLGRRWLVGGVTMLGIALFVWGLAANRPGPDTPRLNCVSYAANFDTGDSWWVSSDRTTREWVRDITGRELPSWLFADEKPTDSWTEQFFPDGTARGAIAEFRGGDKREYLKAPAPAPNFAPFTMKIIGDEMNGERRKVTMHVYSPRMAGRIYLTKRFDGPVYAAQLDGVALEPSDAEWRANFVFMPAAGAHLTLEVDADAALAFFVREESWSYPRFEQYTERPEHMAAEPNRVLDFHSRLHSEHTYTLCTVEPEPMETAGDVRNY
ncbi:MAG TPA: M20/M25/M40 family metallo-hydrolase [Candidatus Hydrogenedentes bacterium]|nr:M20/M25/M40 family metallo-hydrolase [Candidatus Hydrogenedentota bacterium]